MSKTAKIIISILGFIVLAAGIIAGTYLVQKNQDIREKAAPSTNLSFFPAVVTKNAGQAFSLTINADTGSNKITGVDVEISFNPSVIQLTEMKKTAALDPLSTVIKNGTIDNTTGKARFIAFTALKADAISGNLDILDITGTINQSAANGQYPISFTSTTILTAVDEGVNVIVNSTPANITVTSGNTGGNATSAPTNAPTTAPTPTPTTAGGVGGAQITLPTATATATTKSATATATTKPTTAAGVSATTPPDLPVTGVSLPFIGGVVLGMGAIIMSIFLAL